MLISFGILLGAIGVVGYFVFRQRVRVHVKHLPGYARTLLHIRRLPVFRGRRKERV